MKLLAEQLRGVTCIRKPLRIDFDALGEGIICFVGNNGGGKTTAIEMPPVALWQIFPSRPDFYERFNGRDAYLECEFDDHGRRYKARVQVDAEKRTNERYLFIDGSPVASKAGDFKAAVKEHFGSLDAFLVGPFAAQNRRGNFLEKSPADRKKIVAEMLGLQRWDAKHERAKKRRAAVELQLEKIRGAAESIESELFAEGLDRREVLRRQLSEFSGRLIELTIDLSGLMEQETSRLRELDAARSKDIEIRSLEQVYRSAYGEHQALSLQIKAAEDRLAAHGRDSQRQIAELRTLLDPDGEAKIRAGINDRRQQLEKREADCQAKIADEAKVEGAAAEMVKLAAERDELSGRQESLRRLGIDAEIAKTALSAARMVLRNAEAARTRELENLRRQGRLLGDVPCTSAEVWFAELGAKEGHPLPGVCPLLSDAQLARHRRAELEAAEIPERAAVTSAEAALYNAEQRLEELQAVTGNLSELIAANESARKIATEQMTRRLVIADAKKQLEEIKHDLESLDFELELALEQFNARQARITQQIKDAEQNASSQLEKLRTELAALRRQLDTAEDELGLAKTALDAARTEAANVGQAEAALAAVERQRRETEDRIREIEREESATTARLEILDARAKELDQIKLQIEQINQRLGDLKLLELATGRNGVQILEISAAGPGISKKINELLESCYGTRFSVRFETLREKVSSPGEFAEDFDIKISDNGREDSAAGLSGGEQVWIAAAISLGINIYNADRSPIRWETLWLDETAGALDAENARAYVNMLRRARELGGFHQILFVSHSPEVQSMADACLYFDKGEVSLENKESLAA